MTAIRTLIVDDEEGARESLANIIAKYFEQIKVVGKADSAKTGYEKIIELKPDLVFLDIEMPFGNAFDLLARFDEIDFDIIFVTAYDHYAINAIKFSALDYLLKPIDIEDLKAAITRLEKKRKDTNVDERLNVFLQNLRGSNRTKKVAIPESDGLIFVELEKIVRCESDGNYTSITLVGGKRIIASRTLGEYEELFLHERFFRVHRSHLINLNHIKRYIKGEGGYVIMDDDSQVEVSR
ncbi:MAG: LytR/AlgR family response regulator transcription factor [Salibacteraceae bacterium]